MNGRENMGSDADAIVLEGVEQNNLKGFDLSIPRNRLVVVTGMSGSGKSSLAFDTLFAEGQRRYVETFTPYARQFFDRMDKPRVRRITGIPPSIAIEQRNSVKTTRSTVATMTETADYLKILWPHVSRLICPNCRTEIVDEHPGRIWDDLTGQKNLKGKEILICFTLPLSQSLSAVETREMLVRQGYHRALVEAGRSESGSGAGGRKSPGKAYEPQRISELPDECFEAASITVIQDRLAVDSGKRNRFLESAGQAFHFGRNQIAVFLGESGPAESSKAAKSKRDRTAVWTRVRDYSRSQTCAECGHTNAAARPALFNFNHPSGACPDCNGFGRIIRIDYRLAVPDTSLSIAEGVVKPWRSGTGYECQKDLLKFCRSEGMDINRPFRDLPAGHRKLVIEGDPEYGKGRKSRWPHRWYGIQGYFKWLESKSYKMHVRVLLSKYRVYVPCPSCDGKRLKPDALNFRIQSADRDLDISDFLALTVDEALKCTLEWVENPDWDRTNPVRLAAEEVHRRLLYLSLVGLGYLNLNRATRTLSGGETERVSLTTCLGARLVNTLFILDEPSVGLHPRDTAKLIRILRNLRDSGNTVVVVEHEAMVMEAADQIIDLGPYQGSRGGELIFQGTLGEMLKTGNSMTADYLSGKRRIADKPAIPTGKSHPHWIRLRGASQHNLDNVDVDLPLERVVAVTGVSGSGKTTLIRSCLLPALAATGRFPQLAEETPSDSDVDSLPDDDSAADYTEKQSATVLGAEALADVVFVDQSILGRTPRSNPAVYTGAFEPLRKLMARTDSAREKGLTHSSFSFNSAQGQCEKCTGAGFEKIEMQFLSDVYIQCPECNGRRYRGHILDIHLENPVLGKSWNIADFLDATIDDALEFLGSLPESAHQRNTIRCLQPLSEIGLGYLKLGQPINTLSGGESQRLKLVRRLNEIRPDRNGSAEQKILFLFDEPTTGLHFEDIRLLLELFRKIVSQGHSVVFIEHNLELIQAADWVIDLGPDAGADGGRVVFAGTPEKLARQKNSHTGAALKNSRLFSSRTKR